MTSALHDRHLEKDNHTADNWDNLAVDVPQPLRGRYVTNPLAQALRLEQALVRRLAVPLTSMLTSVPTAGTLLPPKNLPVSSSITEKHRMITPIAPKKALPSSVVASEPLLAPTSNAVQRFQELEELSPVELMWQLVKDAMGMGAKKFSPEASFQTPVLTEAAAPAYRIPPFKVRLQQRLNQTEASVVSPTRGENPFALLPLQWASAPPLQRAVRQNAPPSQESVWF